MVIQCVLLKTACIVCELLESVDVRKHTLP